MRLGPFFELTRHLIELAGHLLAADLITPTSLLGGIAVGLYAAVAFAVGLWMGWRARGGQWLWTQIGTERARRREAERVAQEAVARREELEAAHQEARRVLRLAEIRFRALAGAAETEEERVRIVCAGVCVTRARQDLETY